MLLPFYIPQTPGTFFVYRPTFFAPPATGINRQFDWCHTVAVLYKMYRTFYMIREKKLFVCLDRLEDYIMNFHDFL